MADMELKINGLAVQCDFSAIKTKADAVPLDELQMDISGCSGAMDAFIQYYNDFKKTLDDYIDILRKDLSSVGEAVDSICKVDASCALAIDNVANPLTADLLAEVK